MASKKYQNGDDSEIDKIEEADRKGKVNIVKSIMDDPEVQGIIKQSLLRETIKNSIVLTCFLVGLLKLYDVSKTVIGFDWKGDLLISIILVSAGSMYMVKNTLSMKRNNRLTKQNNKKA